MKKFLSETVTETDIMIIMKVKRERREVGDEGGMMKFMVGEKIRFVDIIHINSHRKNMNKLLKCSKQQEALI